MELHVHNPQPKETMICLRNCLNSLSNWTGLKAVPALLPLCPDEDAVLLDVPSFSQTDDYSCGAIAAWSIVETFRPKADFWKFYCVVRPEPDVGVGPKRVLAALKKFRIRTRVRSAMTWRDIRQTVDEGYPMLIGTGFGEDGEASHWSTLYGYVTRPRRVFLGNQVGLVRNQVCIGWGEFVDAWWNPRGQAVVCRGK
jgi:hypothetical protein